MKRQQGHVLTTFLASAHDTDGRLWTITWYVWLNDKRQERILRNEQNEEKKELGKISARIVW